MKDKQPITEGEHRVGINFNPGGDLRVNEIKRMAADLIDFIDCEGKDPRCSSLAMTAFEDGAMWAVKSVTKPER